MKNLLLSLTLCIGLTGCAGLQNAIDAVQVAQEAKITPRQVYIAANAFNAAEATAANYLRLPECGKFPCRIVSVSAVKVIVSAVRTGQFTRNKLEAAVLVDPEAPVDANLFKTLLSSTSDIKRMIGQYSLGGK